MLLPAAEGRHLAQMPVQVHTDNQVGAQRPAEGDRDRIYDPAIDKPLLIVPHRGEQTGQAARCADGLQQRSFFDPHFLTGVEIRRDRGVGDIEIFDLRITDLFADRL